jgi:oligosaccharide repeat unit polymerase
VIITIILLVSLVLVLTGRIIFGKWINPILLYIVPWGIMLVLYEFKLLRYHDLTSETWLVIILALFSFICGIVLVRAIYTPKSESKTSQIHKIDPDILKYIIIFFSLAGLLDAVIHWKVLLSMYGSVAGIFLNANEIYRMRIEGKIPGIIPYLVAFSYAAVFFAAVYSAVRSKIALISFLPFSVIVIKEIANLGRAGILLAIIEFVVAYLFTRNNLKKASIVTKRKNRLVQVAGITAIIVVVIIGASVVRSVRGTYESFAGATKTLSSTRGGILITPSIYFYLSSHVGVLNEFLKDDTHNKMVGGNSFLVVYSILSKFDLVERPSDYPNGYRMPFWSNTGTYLREVIEDFGYIGLFMTPFILGILSTYFWFKLAAKKDLISLLILVYTCILISYSHIVIASRLGLFTISFTIALLTLLMLPKMNAFADKHETL